MALTITTQPDIEQHLRDLGLSRGAKVIVHSALIHFGMIQDGTAGVYRAMREVIGDEGTIVVPTYLLGASPQLVFDPRNTPSLACGSFSEYVRTLEGSIRSQCPLHNHSGIGPDAKVLETVDGSVSLGAGSDFDALYEAGFSTLLLGCPFPDGATFIMHFEAMAEVSFREWTNLERTVVNADGSSRTHSCRYYQRKSNDLVEDLNIVRDILEAAEAFTIAKCGRAESLLLAGSAYKMTLEALIKDPELTLGAKRP